MTETRKTDGYVILTGTIEQENGRFVSFCPELDVPSCGDTIDEAFENLDDALDVHLDALAEIGELGRVFKERNLEVQKGTPSTGPVTVRVVTGKTFRVYQKQVPLAGARN